MYTAPDNSLYFLSLSLLSRIMHESLPSYLCCSLSPASNRLTLNWIFLYLINMYFACSESTPWNITPMNCYRLLIIACWYPRELYRIALATRCRLLCAIRLISCLSSVEAILYRNPWPRRTFPSASNSLLSQWVQSVFVHQDWSPCQNHSAPSCSS